MTHDARDAPAAGGAPDAATILIVDADRVACAYLESSLRRIRGYNVEVANDVAAALETLSNTIVDFVLVDVGLQDSDGFKLVRRIQREPRLANLPLAMMSADPRIASKVAGFELGIHDYFVKPLQIAEVDARIAAILRRAAARRSEAHRRKYNLAGDFSGISFADLANMFTYGQRSGVLSIVTPRAAGRITLVRGEPYQVTFGNIEGPAAFYAMFAERVGQFEFAPDEFTEGIPERRVFQPSMGLLMEAARLLDESGGAKAVQGEPWNKTAGTRPRDAKRVEAARPTSAVARTIEECLADPFTLGELSFFNPEQLADWTSSKATATRFHVVLISDVATGACALASLGSPLAEGQVAAALTERDLSLALTFSLKGEVSAEIVLCSQTTPAAGLSSLRLVPNVLLVAPNDGDWFSLGVEERVDIAQVIDELRPQCILGIGNESIDAGLEETRKLAGVDVPAARVAGSFTEVGFDFREALLAAVRGWAGSARMADSGGRAA